MELWVNLVAALLSAAALAAVAISVHLQSRELRITREQGVRENQLQLIAILLEHPSLRVDAGSTPSEILEYRRSLYLNLLLRHLQLSYLVGESSDAAVAAQAALQLQRAGTRDFWAENRYLFEVEARGDRRKERFVAILDEQFGSAAQAVESERDLSAIAGY